MFTIFSSKSNCKEPVSISIKVASVSTQHTSILDRFAKPYGAADEILLKVIQSSSLSDWVDSMSGSRAVLDTSTWM